MIQFFYIRLGFLCNGDVEMQILVSYNFNILPFALFGNYGRDFKRSLVYWYRYR